MGPTRIYHQKWIKKKILVLRASKLVLKVKGKVDPLLN
jgi:hypothetical protein